MAWRLLVERRAERDLRALPERDGDAMRAALRRLTADPTSVDFKKLGGTHDLWRVRVGQWRAIVRLDNQAGVVAVLRVLPRDRAYRD